MGILDDAIREHLELKRRQGTSDEEVDRQLDEALGGRSTSRPAAQESEEVRQAGEGEGEDPSAEVEEALDDAEEPLEPQRARAPEAASFDDDLDPDEVLPEEALDSMPRDGDWPNGSQAAALEDEELLEEPPDFPAEPPDQDRSWFERKPPKDFDFDD